MVACPGKPIEMTPPQVHMQVHVLFRAGMPPIVVVAAPGVQGLVVTGMQGIGVNTPRAAAVAEATRRHRLARRVLPESLCTESRKTFYGRR